MRLPLARFLLLLWGCTLAHAAANPAHASLLPDSLQQQLAGLEPLSPERRGLLRAWAMASLRKPHLDETAYFELIDSIARLPPARSNPGQHLQTKLLLARARLGQKQYRTLVDSAHGALHQKPANSTDSLVLGHLHSLVGQGYYRLAQLDSMRHHLERAVTILPGPSSPFVLAEAFNELGLARELQGQTDTALHAYRKAAAIAKTHGLQHILHSIYTNLGIVLKNTGKPFQALEYHRKSLAIKKQLGDSLEISKTYNNIGNIFFNQLQYQQALIYFRRTLRIRQQLDAPRYTARALSNIGSVYGELEQYPQAIRYQQRSLALLQSLGDTRGVAFVRNSLAGYLLQLDSVAKALRLYHLALTHNRAEGNTVETGWTFANISQAFTHLGQPDSVLAYGRKAMQIAEASGQIRIIAHAADDVAHALAKKGRYREAFEIHTRFLAAHDSVQSAERSRKVAQKEFAYKLKETRERQRMEQARQEALYQAEVKRQKLLRNATVAGLGLTGVLALFIFRGYRMKKRANLQLSEKNRLISSQNAEIRTQRDNILHQNSQLEQQKEEIAAQRDELEATLHRLRETQDRLIEAEKMGALGQMVAGMAHEISTPIGIGLSAASHLDQAADSLQSALAGNQLSKRRLTDFIREARESSGFILNNLHKANQLLERFREAAYLQQGDERPSTVQPDGYLAEIMHSMRQELQQRNAQWHWGRCDRVSLTSYPNALMRVIVSLVLNALEHGFAGQNGQTSTLRIEIEALASENACQIAIVDNGCGLTPEAQAKAFEPFFTTARGKGHTGMGLAMAYHLVTNQLQGRIWLEEASPQGTRAVVRLPLQLADPNEAAPVAVR